MTKKERFNVAVAAFEALLANSGLTKVYMDSFCCQRLGGQSDNIYTDWKNWASLTQVDMWLTAAFKWDYTSIDFESWRDIDYTWLRWICTNLIK